MHIFLKNKFLYFGHYKIKCAIGKRGISKNKKEGDLCTPIGQFVFESLFYRKDRIKNLKTYNYGLEVKTGKFSFGKTSSIAPNSLTIVYALSIANSGKAKKIFVSGLDGYPMENPRRHEMDETLRIYFSSKKRSELISITPSRYKIKSSSVYA